MEANPEHPRGVGRKSPPRRRLGFARTMTETLVALSVKQPWAALLVAGLKTVEVPFMTATLRAT